jgi:hypothetical protein
MRSLLLTVILLACGVGSSTSQVVGISNAPDSPAGGLTVTLYSPRTFYLRLIDDTGLRRADLVLSLAKSGLLMSVVPSGSAPGWTMEWSASSDTLSFLRQDCEAGVDTVVAEVSYLPMELDTESDGIDWCIDTAQSVAVDCEGAEVSLESEVDYACWDDLWWYPWPRCLSTEGPHRPCPSFPVARPSWGAVKARY